MCSASQTQANDLVKEVALHLRTLERAARGPIIKGKPGVTQIETVRGGLVRAMSTRPAGLRGPGGNLTLDEFAWAPNSREVWTAASAITDPTLGNPHGYKLRVISTPAGDDEDNQFWRLWHKPEGAVFSKHTVTIFDAVRMGFPVDPEEKREQVDAELFEQEYNCSFLSSSSRYISSELLDKCVYYSPKDVPQGVRYRGYAGMDVARKRDNSAIEEGRLIGDMLWNVDGEARRGVEWDEQERWAGEVIEGKWFATMAVDETGLGSQFAERLVKKYGQMRVKPVSFSSHNQREEVITGLGLASERGRLRIRNDLELRRDILNLRREIKGGSVRYDAQRTSKGHCDRAIALALMIHAAGGMAKNRVLRPRVESGKRAASRYGWG